MASSSTTTKTCCPGRRSWRRPPVAEQVAGRLALESGAVFEGWLFGADVAESDGEVVFNTCMAGYQEVISDPSYAGQVVVMTHPLIGNYGCRDDTAESYRVHCRALVVRELSVDAGHARAERTLDEELRRWDVPGLRGVDTRALTRHLRDHGIGVDDRAGPGRRCTLRSDSHRPGPGGRGGARPAGHRVDRPARPRPRARGRAGGDP